MAEEAARTGHSLWTMDQGQRTAAHVREDPLTDAFVVACEFELREVEIRIDQAIGM
jgi:hypothetical protein